MRMREVFSYFLTRFPNHHVAVRSGMIKFSSGTRENTKSIYVSGRPLYDEGIFIEGETWEEAINKFNMEIKNREWK